MFVMIVILKRTETTDHRKIKRHQTWLSKKREGPLKKGEIVTYNT